jgi:hypothetical protein
MPTFDKILSSYYYYLDYEPMQIVATHNYYGTNRRTGHGSRNSHMHDLSSGYYYENSQT